MLSSVRRYAAKRPIRSVLLGLLLASACYLGSSFVAGEVRYAIFAARVTAAAQVPPTGNPVSYKWPVSFDRNLYRFEIEVFPSEVAAASRLRTAWVFGSGSQLRERYVRRLVHAQSTSRLIDRLAEQARSIRQRRKLSDDAYARLLARTVQSIPYGKAKAEILMPAEVVANGSGVCTEKSLLLAALLLHEGYDTAVLVLDAHQHVAVGVKTLGARFRDLPYAFIETTAEASVGEVASDYLGWGPIGWRPQVIEVGGRKLYRDSPT